MNHTKNYGLPQWELNDLIRMEDFNSAMSNIENGLNSNKSAAEAGDAELQRQVNAANAKAEAAQSAAGGAYSPAFKPYAVGSYVGNGQERRVELGFRPSFVIISGMEHHIGNTPTAFTNYVVMTGGHVMSNEIWFTDTGFTVNGSSGWVPQLSVSGRTYDYIAFK